MKYGFYPGCSYHSAAGYKESVDAVVERIGFDWREIDDWTCCGATSFFSLDAEKALALPARVFALAKSQGFDQVVTVCNACFATMKKAAKKLHENPALKAAVDDALKAEGLTPGDDLPVRHLLEVFVQDVPEDVWRAGGANGRKLSVAAYYGCQLTRPFTDVGHPDRPDLLETFFKRLGLDPVSHSAATLCCGAAHAVPYEAACRPLIERIVREIRAKGGDMAATICPMCQINLDAGQKTIGSDRLPVPYFTQVAGLAMGIDPARLGLSKLLIPVRGV